MTKTRTAFAVEAMIETGRDLALAVFDDHVVAVRALHKLLATGFKVSDLSFVGKGFCNRERVLGWADTGRGAKFWGVRRTLWQELWPLFGGGLILTTPETGPVFMMGKIAEIAEGTLDDGLIVGGMGALGAALYSMGMPRDDAACCDDWACGDRFILMVHGSALDTNLAMVNLETSRPQIRIAYCRLEPRLNLAA